MRRRRTSRGNVEYLLEDFQPYKGFDLYLNGSCDIDYVIDDDDPDVGYFGGVDIDVTRISLFGTEKGKLKREWNIDQTLELYKVIKKRLLDDYVDSICEVCAKDSMED